jgi:hypothetical protein
MRIIALVERNVCELAHISFCFCADALLRRAETKEPRWCVALPLSTTTWVLGNWAREQELDLVSRPPAPVGRGRRCT